MDDTSGESGKITIDKWRCIFLMRNSS